MTTLSMEDDSVVFCRYHRPREAPGASPGKYRGPWLRRKRDAHAGSPPRQAVHEALPEQPRRLMATSRIPQAAPPAAIATISDVAKQAGVSIKTVSRVMN